MGYDTAMVDDDKIRQIAQQVATANLPSGSVSSVIIGPSAFTSEGRDALRITIVLTPGSTDKIQGDAVLNTLVQTQQKLEQEGEERFPIVEYATKKELEESGGS
jgi:hypothetical protein